METGRGLDQETFDLTLQAIGDFAKAELSDTQLLEYDEKDVFPETVVRAIGGHELGVQLIFVPEEYGGMGGGAFDVYRVCEEMARIDLGLATGVLATFLGSDPIVFGGTAQQRQKWLGRIAEEGLLMAYGATEPQAGSDLAALRSVARRVVEDGEVVGYRITGNKQWISNGGFADVYTVLADAPDGPSWFIVERGEQGLGHGKPEDKHGIRASNTAAVTLEDVYVGRERLVGEQEGQGLKQAQAVFGFTRLMVAAFGLGAGWAALDRAIPYSVERKQGGQPLSEKQGYTHKLIVPHAVRLETARAFIEDTAERIDAGEGSLNTEGAIAKYLASEAGNAAADASIQALGGYGYTREYMVEKIRRDVRITTIYEGTSEIMEMTISRDRWQLHLRSRGQYYHQQADDIAAMETRQPSVGAHAAALALHALAEVLESARAARLTRNQHVLFRLGELIAHAEGAACLAHKAVAHLEGRKNPKSPERFDGRALALFSRIAAREAAMKVAEEGLKWVRGAAAPSSASDGPGARGETSRLQTALRLPEIHAAQAGLLLDMNEVADLLYGRI